MRIARIPIRRPRLVLVVVVSVAVLAGLAGRTVAEHLSNSVGDFVSWESESYEAEAEFEAVKAKGGRGAPNIALLIDGTTKAFSVRRELQELPQVETVLSQIFPARKDDVFAVLGWLRKDLPEGPAAVKVAQALERPGVKVGGFGLLAYQLTEQTKSDLLRAELIAFPLLLIAGLWVFRSIVAGLLPLLVGVLTLLIVSGCIRALAIPLSLSLFSLNIALAMALGLVVDYGLLIVSRFREELAAGRSPREAAGVTLATAGRTVAISCLAISAAASSLLVFPIYFVRSAGFTGMVVAPIAGAVSLLVLPALLTLLGERVNALAPASWQRGLDRTARPRSAGFWYRTGRFVMRRAVPVAVLSSLLLILLSLPALGMRFTGFDTTSLPPSSSVRAFAEEAREKFAHPGLGEIELAIHGNQKTATRVSNRVEKLSKRTRLAVPAPFGLRLAPGLWQVDLNPTHALLSRKTRDFVERLRAMDAPMKVAGETAAYIDTTRSLERWLPYAIAILVLVTLLFFGFATRSVVLPIKAVLMNVLSLGATCGILVLIFQDGRFQGVMGYESQNALVLVLPIIVGAGAFGLLTDYGLFLLMRIKEAREEGRSDPDAIALGLERTGRIITAAALLFCFAVGPFATSELLLIKEGVLGIMTAVLIDAFVVRPLLVPSLMMILGKWNWWPREVPSHPEPEPRAQSPHPSPRPET